MAEVGIHLDDDIETGSDRLSSRPAPAAMGSSAGAETQQQVSSSCIPIQMDTGRNLQPASHTTCSRPSAMGSPAGAGNSQVMSCACFENKIDYLVMVQKPQTMHFASVSPPQWGVWLGRTWQRRVPCASSQVQIDALVMIRRPQAMNFSRNPPPLPWGVGWGAVAVAGD